MGCVIGPYEDPLQGGVAVPMNNAARVAQGLDPIEGFDDDPVKNLMEYLTRNDRDK
jgi:hypothetical protein